MTVEAKDGVKEAISHVDFLAHSSLEHRSRKPRVEHSIFRDGKYSCLVCNRSSLVYFSTATAPAKLVYVTHFGASKSPQRLAIMPHTQTSQNTALLGGGYYLVNCVTDNVFPVISADHSLQNCLLYQIHRTGLS